MLLSGLVSGWGRFIEQSKHTLNLALPMIMGQVGMMALSLIDTAMVGHYSLEDLAGVAFGGGLVLFVLVIGMGLCTAVHILVSQAAVDKDGDAALDYLTHGNWIVTIYAGVVAIVITLWPDLLYYFGQKADVVEHAKLYSIFMAWSVLPALVARCFKNYYEAMGKPWLPFFITSSAIVLNVFFNWVFIFGNLGMPEMGGAGAGLGTLLARVMGPIINGVVILRLGKDQFARLFSFNWGIFVKMLKIGVPTLVQIAFEFGFFTVAMIMVGWIGAVQLGAQLIVTNYTAFTFMLPLGLSFATTVRVSHAHRKKGVHGVRSIGFNGITLGTIAGFSFFCMTLIFRDQIPYFFVEEESIISVVTYVLMFAAFLQFFDGIQATVMGALRGLQDLWVPLGIVFFSYWVIGTPLGYYLAFSQGWGIAGIWVGIVTGIGVGSALLTIRFNSITRL